jgi:hypothetical protein
LLALVLSGLFIIQLEINKIQKDVETAVTILEEGVCE